VNVPQSRKGHRVRAPVSPRSRSRARDPNSSSFPGGVSTSPPQVGMRGICRLAAIASWVKRKWGSWKQELHFIKKGCRGRGNLVVRKLPTYNHKHKHSRKDKRTGCFKMSDVMCLTRASRSPAIPTCSLLLVDITNALTFFELPLPQPRPPPNRPLCASVCEGALPLHLHITRLCRRLCRRHAWRWEVLVS